MSSKIQSIGYKLLCILAFRNIYELQWREMVSKSGFWVLMSAEPPPPWQIPEYAPDDLYKLRIIVYI